jgi:hypothetical protein
MRSMLYECVVCKEKKKRAARVEAENRFCVCLRSPECQADIVRESPCPFRWRYFTFFWTLSPQPSSAPHHMQQSSTASLLSTNVAEEKKRLNIPAKGRSPRNRCFTARDQRTRTSNNERSFTPRFVLAIWLPNIARQRRSLF